MDDYEATMARARARIAAWDDAADALAEASGRDDADRERTRLLDALLADPGR